MTTAAEEPASPFDWNDAAAAQLLDAVRRADEDGLDPADYRLAELQSADRSPASDALRSRVLRRLARDLHQGRLDREAFVPGIELTPAEHTAHVEELLARATADATLPAALRELRPQAAIYTALRVVLDTYRSMAARGGWTSVPEGPTLHPGERSARTQALRARLLATNDLRDATPATDPELYAGTLVDALRHFQGRHQLDVDGLLGKRTLAELNVPVEARIDQVRVNLERARWLLNDLPADYVLVDIAGFEVRYVRGGAEVLRSRAVVGKPYRRTPIFRSAIAFLEFAPTWTVPPTILRNDVLPDIRKDPQYLRRKGMRLIDAGGSEVDPAGVDWSRYTGRRVPPFMIRQDPGPENALGRVKFMFPNAYHVYLHDTPQRELFARSERTFSSGCIRVEQAARFAELLLEAQGWDAAQVAAAMAGATTRRVDLAKRVPVLLYYWTVALEDDGDILFKRDVYDRDGEVLRGLDADGPLAALPLDPALSNHRHHARGAAPRATSTPEGTGP